MGLPTFPSPGSGGLKPSHRPLADDVALELGEGAEDVEGQTSAGGGRVDTLGQRPEADAAPVEISYDFDQVRQGSGEPVEFPDYQHVALGQIRQSFVQLGTVGAHAAHPVLEDAPSVDASLQQRIDLEVPVLVRRGYPRVADQHDLKNPQLTVLRSLVLIPFRK